MPDAPTVIVLAAGCSRRMGDRNKLLLTVGGRPVLAHVLRAVTEAPVGEVIVVSGAQHAQITVLVGRVGAARVAHNPDFRSGMASSIRRGVEAGPSDATGYAICPGDLPLLSGGSVRRLCRTFAEKEGPCIVRPTYEGQPGHPVLFDASFRGALMSIRGDQGAREVIRRNEAVLTRVPVEDEGVCQDVDTPDALRRARRQVPNGE